MTSTTCLEDAPFPAVISDAVRDAILTTFEPICGVTPEPLPYCAVDEPCAGVVAVISFTGQLAWSFALVLPAETACHLALKFAGFEIPYDSPDMGDAVGELANVVAGDISARLDRKGVKANMSLPFVARGHDVEMLQSSGLTSTKMGFSCPEGTFSFKLASGKPGHFLTKRSGA